MRCSVVFGVTLRLLVINVFVVFSRKTPPLTTSDVSQLAVRLTCSTSDSVDNTWLVAAFTARTKARYRLRIVISAYPTCIRRPNYYFRQRRSLSIEYWYLTLIFGHLAVIGFQICCCVSLTEFHQNLMISAARCDA